MVTSGEDSHLGDPDPYPNLAWMREMVPITKVHSMAGPAWFVTPYEHVRALLADSRLSNDGHRHNDDPESFGTLLNCDAPTHPRLRRVIAGAFSPRAVGDLRATVARICAETLDGFAGRGHADLVADFARPIPIAVIMELLGVPKQARPPDEHTVDVFTRSILEDADAIAESTELVRQFIDYKRVHPGDDVATMLLTAYDRGELVDLREVHGLLSLLIGAGHTTTIPFLATAAMRIVQHPDVQARVAGDADFRRRTVEEVLRYDSTVQVSVSRFAAEDIEIGGVTIAKGDRVVLSLAAANRDPERFDGPDIFRPELDRATNVAFGHGVHLCVGANLARLEGDLALAELFRRLPDLRLDLDPADVAWQLIAELRCPQAIPVIFAPAA